MNADGSEDDYGIVFTRADFAAVAAALARIKGRFLLSINDVPDTRAAFGAFRTESIETRYTIAGGAWADAGELIVMGPRADDPVWDGSPDRLI